MANQKISDLSGLSFAANDDELVIVDSSESETKKNIIWKINWFVCLFLVEHIMIAFLDYVADEHIDWTNATDNFFYNRDDSFKRKYHNRRDGGWGLILLGYRYS